ncbi:hypothetical protein M8J77_016773 [Diaphorina citri]|nr:hypothetical protein M8J77_016773 [Diaphorina citri]
MKKPFTDEICYCKQHPVTSLQPAPTKPFQNFETFSDKFQNKDDGDNTPKQKTKEKNKTSTKERMKTQEAEELHHRTHKNRSVIFTTQASNIFTAKCHNVHNIPEKVVQVEMKKVLRDMKRSFKGEREKGGEKITERKQEGRKRREGQDREERQ